MVDLVLTLIIIKIIALFSGVYFSPRIFSAIFRENISVNSATVSVFAFAWTVFLVLQFKLYL